MTRIFKILDPNNVDWLLIDEHSHTPSEYVSYRHFICHGLHHLLHTFEFSSDDCKDDCKKEFNKLKTEFGNNRPYVNENFVRLYQINSPNTDPGNVLVDETGCCYPLIIDNPERKQALTNSINDIDKHLDEIMSELSQNKDWDKNLQSRLDNIYQFSSYDK